MHVPAIPRQPKRKAPIWSIGIFSGPKLTDLRPLDQISMPVLSAADVTDAPAQFVADPFMISVESSWYMFFEVMNAQTDKGEIGLAKSTNGVQWNYQQIVLSEPFHLSYPHVFCLDNQYFMIPESYEANSITLYRAVSFPTKWEPLKILLEGAWVDSSVFFFDGLWWLFSNPLRPPNQVLELFYSTSMAGPWHRHPRSPLIEGNNRVARGAGRIIVVNGKPVRFAQDCFPAYGSCVRAFEICILTESSYEEQELETTPILKAGGDFWRCGGMHHIDPHFINGQWIACVDGWRLPGS